MESIQNAVAHIETNVLTKRVPNEDGLFYMEFSQGGENHNGYNIMWDDPRTTVIFTNFKKNPIMLYNHQTPVGSFFRYSYLGNNLFSAEAQFDKTAKAQEVRTQFVERTLNGISTGIKAEFVEYNSETEMLDIYGKIYMEETSIVDFPNYIDGVEASVNKVQNGKATELKKGDDGMYHLQIHNAITNANEFDLKNAVQTLLTDTLNSAVEKEVAKALPQITAKLNNARRVDKCDATATEHHPRIVATKSELKRRIYNSMLRK